MSLLTLHTFLCIIMGKWAIKCQTVQHTVHSSTFIHTHSFISYLRYHRSAVKLWILTPQHRSAAHFCAEWFTVDWSFKGSGFLLMVRLLDLLCQRVAVCPSAHKRWMFGLEPSVTPCMMGGADCLCYLGHLAKAVVCVAQCWGHTCSLYNNTNRRKTGPHTHSDTHSHSHTDPWSSAETIITPLQIIIVMVVPTMLGKNTDIQHQLNLRVY